MSGRCLVTGGRGFLGRHLVKALGTVGYDVVAPSHAELDVASSNAWANLPGDFDAVVHAAAFVPSAAASPADVPSIAAIGLLGTLHGLCWARERRVRRFVYCSSSDVYAPGVLLPVTESAATGPEGPAAYYGLGKLWGDELCRAYRASTGAKTVSLRLSAIHGPGMRPRGVVSAFWRGTRDGAALDVRAPQASGDFLYVDDACAAVLAALRAPEPGPVYNIGSGTETTLLDLATEIWRVRRRDRPADIRAGHEAGRRFVLAIDRARDGLGYRPHHDLRSGLEAWARAEP